MDSYEILGVKKGSSKDEIRKAFRNKAKLYHPDINKSKDADKKFLEIKEAYERLMSGREEPEIPKREEPVRYQQSVYTVYDLEQEILNRFNSVYSQMEKAYNYKMEEEYSRREAKRNIRIGIAQIIGFAISATLSILEIAGVIDINFLILPFACYAIAYPKFILPFTLDKFGTAQYYFEQADQYKFYKHINWP